MPLPPDHRADQGLERAALLLTEMVDSVDADAVRGAGRRRRRARRPSTCAPASSSSLGMLRGWDGAAVPQLLGERLGLPVYVDNDANLGALAEVRLGAARGKQHVVYVRASHGVGGGLVLGGEVFHGRVGRRGRDRAHDDRRPGPRLPLRQPRLPRDVRRRARAARHAAARATATSRCATSSRRAEAGDAGCRRVIADAGHHLGVAAAERVQPVRPRAPRGRRRARGRGGAAARAAARGARPAHHPQHRRARSPWSARSSAPRPRCAARSPWRSTRSRSPAPGRWSCDPRRWPARAVAVARSPWRACAARPDGRRPLRPGHRPAAPGVEDRPLRGRGPPRSSRRSSPTAAPSAPSSTPTPTRTPPRQQQQAESALTQGAGVLVLDAVDAAAAVSIVGQAHRRGVPVIAYDRFIADADLDYYVSFDSRRIGRLPGRGAGPRAGRRPDRARRPAAGRAHGQRRRRPTRTPRRSRPASPTRSTGAASRSSPSTTPPTGARTRRRSG